jgi:hypothetical protein
VGYQIPVDWQRRNDLQVPGMEYWRYAPNELLLKYDNFGTLALYRAESYRKKKGCELEKQDS